MKFPNPHDFKTIPGTEGWERMYPYQYQFVTDDPERKEYEEKAFWFYDGLHYPEAIYPFDTIWDEAWYLGSSQYNNRIFQVPPMEKVRAERDRIIEEYRSLINTEEEHKTFDDLLNTAKTVFPYVENHLYYVEHWFHTVFWKKMREVSAIMVEHKMINDVEDIWYMRRDEIKQALWDIEHAVVDGPFALDNAISLVAAKQKKIGGDVAGRADIVLVPNLQVGNVIHKGLTYLANKKIAAAVMGAKVPIVMTSRADTTDTKLYSIAITTFIS